MCERGIQSELAQGKTAKHWKIGQKKNNRQTAVFGKIKLGALTILVLTLGVGGLSRQGQAAPPAYLVLRRVEAPGPHGQPGHWDAALVERRASGYAYGFFGVAPRAHASRHFGFYRTYTQWSTW